MYDRLSRMTCEAYENDVIGKKAIVIISDVTICHDIMSDVTMSDVTMSIHLWLCLVLRSRNFKICDMEWNISRTVRERESEREREKEKERERERERVGVNRGLI